MSLSSNTLVHLTKYKKSLLGVLKERFIPKYCIEELATRYDDMTKKNTITLAYPMVSFCDIPLSEIRKHIESYGNYGIGLSKKWANKIGLNPVLYFDKDSELINSFKADLAKMIKENKMKSDLGTTFIKILSYSKNYEADLTRRKKTKKNYRFSDEREWRYVPTPSELLSHCAPSFVMEDEYDTKEKKAKKNEVLKKMRLHFDIDDIKYIFIKNESEIDEIISAINEIAGNEKHKSVSRLTSRILTIEQIKTDM
jgi:hypothetical protein